MMGPLWFPRLALPALLTLPSLCCPPSCRCYSLTVECGSLGITQVPQEIPAFTQTVFLQDNAIVQIRLQDMSRLGFLHYLYLQNNSISGLEQGAFLSQGQLLELALNGNLIHLVSADVFRGLEHLRILYLSGNQITKLQDHTFRGLQRLQELHLQENSIEVLEDEALSGLSSLALLDLSRNQLRTLGPASLRPLVSLQVLRVTENSWRCDCALGWLRTWILEEGQRLLSLAEQRLLCAEPPRLSHLSLVDVAANSLVCIPPVVQLEPSHLTVRLGESLRVSCQASGYPQPQVTWKKTSHSKAQLSPRGLLQEQPEAHLFRVGSGRPSGGMGTSRPRVGKLRDGAGISGMVRGTEEGGERDSFDPDTGSGMLFLSNVTVAHAGRYECEAWNPGGVARVTFHLAVNMSSSSSYSAIWPRLHSSPSSSSFHPPEVVDVSQEPVYELESMDFNTLGSATQTAIAMGISLLALTALLLIIMIFTRHQQCRKEEGGGFCGSKQDSILYVNHYSDGLPTFPQLEDLQHEQGHEMFLLNRAKPVLSPEPAFTLLSGFGHGGLKEALLEHQGLQVQTLSRLGGMEHQGLQVQTLSRLGGMGPHRNPAEGGERPLIHTEGMLMNQSLLGNTQVAYEIHC